MYLDFNNRFVTTVFASLLIRHLREIPSTPTCYIPRGCEICGSIREFHQAGILEEIIKQAESYILADLSESGWWHVQWNSDHSEILSERVDITLFQRMWNIRSVVVESRSARKIAHYYFEEK